MQEEILDHHCLLQIYYNRVGPFNALSEKDPRVEIYFEPRVNTPEIIGLPYGFGNAAARAVEDESKPGAEIIKPNYNQLLLSYSEIEFIRSEFNSWNQTNYENGIKASMAHWGGFLTLMQIHMLDYYQLQVKKLY